jgi:hypothetical protein
MSLQGLFRYQRKKIMQRKMHARGSTQGKNSPCIEVTNCSFIKTRSQCNPSLYPLHCTHKKNVTITSKCTPTLSNYAPSQHRKKKKETKASRKNKFHGCSRVNKNTQAHKEVIVVIQGITLLLIKGKTQSKKM